MKVVVIAGLMVACSKAEMSHETCKREASELQATLRAADTGTQAIFVDSGMQLVKRADLVTASARVAPVLEVGERATTFQGSTERVGERLRETRTRLVDDLASGRVPNSGVPNPALLYILVDARAHWDRVVEAWQLARDAELTAPAFVFAMPVTLTPPPRAPIDDTLDRLMTGSPADRASGLAKLVDKEVERCPALIRSFSSIAPADGDSKATYLIDQLGPALVECHCRVDLPNLRALFWRVIANPSPTRILAFDPAAPPAKIALPEAATWADAAARFTPDLKNAELAIE